MATELILLQSHLFIYYQKFKYEAFKGHRLIGVCSRRVDVGGKEPDFEFLELFLYHLHATTRQVRFYPPPPHYEITF